MQQHCDTQVQAGQYPSSPMQYGSDTVGHMTYLNILLLYSLEYSRSVFWHSIFWLYGRFGRACRSRTCGQSTLRTPWLAESKLVAGIICHGRDMLGARRTQEYMVWHQALSLDVSSRGYSFVGSGKRAISYAVELTDNKLAAVPQKQSCLPLFVTCSQFFLWLPSSGEQSLHSRRPKMNLKLEWRFAGAHRQDMLGVSM